MPPNNIDINDNYNNNQNSDNNNKGLCNSCNFVFPLISANFEAFKCAAYLRAGDAYAKERRINANDILNLLVTVSFQITVNSCYYVIYFYIFQNYLLVIFIVSLLIYLLHMYFNLVAVRLWSGFR